MAATDSHQWFTSIGDSTPADWEILVPEDVAFRAQLSTRVMDHMRLLGEQNSSFHVTRLWHLLQSATMAYRDGRDDAYIACALLHDIGDTIASFNHADVAAAVVKPFVSDDYHWMIQHHAIFQGHYFWQHLGADPDTRERFRDHPCFDMTEEFCAVYDNPAFDPNYPVMQLEEFAPLLADFFSNPRAFR